MHTWSETNLGQWHYVLGYLIVLTSHNWPIMLALAGSVWFGYKAYRTPNRRWVSWLLSALVGGLMFEYHKHIAPTFHAAVDFLFLAELSAVNRFFHLLVGPIATAGLILGWLALLVQAVRPSSAA
jgi:hypothetical protein